jgi:4-amino-4-deoxychorismate lyase
MVIALLDGSVHDAAQPLLHGTDLGVLRGDGAFETLLAVDGRPRKFDAHLARLRRSAAMLDLPAPADGEWRRAVAAAVAAAGTGGQTSTDELVVRLVLTRGVEGTGRPTGYVTAAPVPESIRRARRDGVRVITLPRGVDRAIADVAPWLLLGAKTLSYAVNMAAIREAERRGADDAIFLDDRGHVLEGPTATVVAAVGTAPPTLRTPPPDGILPGTTQRALFRAAEHDGWKTVVEPLTVSDLQRAAAVWLVSSVRLAAPVVELDGVRIAREIDNDELLRLIASAEEIEPV